MNKNNDILKQLPLDFATHTYMGRDDFMVSECNKEAFMLLDSWPNWLGSGAVIYGPKGCGKSHLAQLLLEKVRNVSAPPAAASVVNCSAINMRNFKKLVNENKVLVVENLRPGNHDEALFHLFNLFNVAGRWILFTAEKAPAQMKFALKDLQTRLNMLPCAAISEPDDVMLQMLIVKLFDDRQLKITPEILQYIINNAPRSFAYIEKLVAEIDEISLAYQTAVTYTVIRRAMEFLELKDRREPDLFEDY